MNQTKKTEFDVTFNIGDLTGIRVQVIRMGTVVWDNTWANDPKDQGRFDYQCLLRISQSE